MSRRSPPPKRIRHEFDDDKDADENSSEHKEGADSLEKYIKMVYEGEDVEFNQKFKMQKWRATFMVEDLPSTNPENLLRLIFQKCIDEAIDEAKTNGIVPDNLGFGISSPLLSYDIWIPIRPISENTVEAALNRFMLVAQSKTAEGNLFGEPFSITVTTVDKKQLSTIVRRKQLEGSGNRRLAQVQHRISRKCLIPVNNHADSYCLFHALFLTYTHKMKLISADRFYRLVHRDHQRRQREVEQLMEEADIPFGLASYDAKTYVPSIIKYWNDIGAGRNLIFKVFIFEPYGDYKPAYMHGPNDFNIPIVLYYDSNHFWGVRSVAGLFERNNYCLVCLSPYGDAKSHRKDCSRLCLNCGRMGYSCCLSISELDYERLCEGCSKKFVNK